MTVQIPDYPEAGTTMHGRRPGIVWRRDDYQAIRSAAASHGIKKYKGVDLECEVIVHLSHTKMHFHDVDNLQNHIFDALQGRLGRPKGRERSWALLPNDYQIRKVVVEKRERRSRKEQSRLTSRDFAKIERYRKAHPEMKQISPGGWRP